jgi:crotonobetainyl-CoA:carnitine CoA-transferase CaiB-like acyl-CoA transferase
MTAPLQGIRVVEVANWMAAPGATAILADLGADVVKVEPLSGDAMRGATRLPSRPDGAAPLDASFHMDNRGKRGIAVALNEPDGVALVRRLVADADVFVNNLLPERQRRFGLDPDALMKENGRLVHATLTGYGLDGPDAQRPGYDLTAFFGRGGISHLMTEPAGSAPRVRPAQGDHTAALALATAILAALRLVEAQGEGQVIDVSLYATSLWTMGTDLSPALVDGQNPPPIGRKGRPHALHGTFRCADERLLLLFMPEPHWWPKFCEAADRQEWIDDERFATFPARLEHMSPLTDLLDELFATRPLAEWADRFDRAGLIWAPASTLAEIVADPHAEAVGLFPQLDHPSGEPFRTVGIPFAIHGADIGPRGAGPEIGQHTREVLAGLGLGAHEIDALVQAGVVGEPPAGMSAAYTGRGELT